MRSGRFCKNIITDVNESYNVTNEDEVLFPEQVLDKNWKAPWNTEPREMTVAEISVALGHEVKIVK